MVYPQHTDTSSLAKMVTLHKGWLVKVTILVAVSIFIMFGYLTFFQHPPPDQLLLNNRRRIDKSGRGRFDFGASLFSDGHSSQDENTERIANEDVVDSVDDTDINKNEDEEDDDDGDKVSEKNNNAVKDDVIVHKKRGLGIREESEIEDGEHWDNFLKQQDYVPIGAVYTQCEGRRKQLGAVVLLEDKKNGGIMARTFVNVTLDKTLDGGQLNIESRYNGRLLYENYWELCEVEDDLPDEEKTFVCPLKPGFYSRVKDKAIPGFLPKGRYQSKIWAKDEDGKILGCGYSDFTI